MMIKHFSHQHPLSPYKVEEDQDIICCVCEEEILPTSPAYKCNKKNKLHIVEIQHSSRHQHSLTLLPKPPSYLFNCAACAGDNSSFIYNCAACEFTLHVWCSGLESVKRPWIINNCSNSCFRCSWSGRKMRRRKKKKRTIGAASAGAMSRSDAGPICVKSVKKKKKKRRKKYPVLKHLKCVGPEVSPTSRYSGGEEEEEDEEEKDEDDDEEEEEDEDHDDGDDNENEEDLDVIVENQKMIFVQQMAPNNQINMRWMRMQQKMMMDNTRRLF
ncbi:hypothetical protein L484_021602 [Morus notabilis]|uniref:DC1 domain-containing protein n=1 Tax=Morus notabilis TaxID=981085 RepID=W9RXX7_9ROSA|nr:hypothetical protein L484_021602 [Morus notabilis]